MKLTYRQQTEVNKEHYMILLGVLGRTDNISENKWAVLDNPEIVLISPGGLFDSSPWTYEH